MSSTRSQLVELIDQGALAPKDLQQAVVTSELYPDGRAWYHFLDRLLLWMASLALAISVLFFVAYNWSEWGRFSQLALVEVALLLAVAVYVRFGHNQVTAQASLMAATLLLGVLLALVGQVYQTGADTWKLFFAWAMLMLPWALLGRSALLWIFWVALLNLSGVLYFQTFGFFGLLFYASSPMLWFLFLFNALVLIVWEVTALRWDWMAIDWARRLIAVTTGAAISWLVLTSVLDGSVTGSSLLVYGLWLAGLYGAYRRWRLDLFMLTVGCFSLNLVIPSLFFRGLFDESELFGLLLFIIIVILGLGAAFAFWLKMLHKEAKT